MVKPRIGSVVKVALSLPGAEHSGIYIGNDEIVEVANIDGTATVRIVSAEEFIEGDDCISRIGTFIYVACKQDRDGNCIAMGSQDIADRARAAVGETSKYCLVFNDCHSFTEYCVSGKRTNLAGILAGVEVALDKKFIKNDYERLLDMWRSTGESRGDNPCFVDDDETESDNDPEADEDFEDEENSEFEELLEKAESGDAESQYQVGQMYFTGDGIELDEGEAMDWFERAAQNGHAEAMYELGECYYLGMGVEEDEEEAVKWYRKAARKGHVEAMYKMAGCYYSGDGVAESDARAKHW